MTEKREREKKKTYSCVRVSGRHNHHFGVNQYILPDGHIVDICEEDRGLFVAKDKHVHCSSVVCHLATSIPQLNLELRQSEQDAKMVLVYKHTL